MNKPTERGTLEDVLNAYVASGADPNDPLDEWIRLYPKYEKELIEFAVNWSLMNSLPPTSSARETDEDTLVLRGMSVVQNLLHAQSLGAASEPIVPFTSLLEESRARGLKPGQLAQELKVGDSVLRKLDRRLILFTSIPQKLIEGLAKAIHRNTALVEAYLQQSSTFAAAAEHRSEQVPALADQEDFFDAVRADSTIKREHAEFWFALKRSIGTK